MKSKFIKNLSVILSITVLFTFFINSYASALSFNNDYRVYEFENGGKLITKTVESNEERNVVISINELSQVRRTTFYKKNKLLVQEILEEPQTNNLNSTSSCSILESIMNNELTFEYINQMYRTVEVDKTYLNQNHGYNFDTKSNVVSEPTEFNNHSDDSEENIVPMYIIRNSFGKYSYSRYPIPNNYVVTLTIPNDYFQTPNLYGGGPVRSRVIGLTNTFNSYIDSLKDSVDSLVREGIGLIPGSDAVMTIYDIIEKFFNKHNGSQDTNLIKDVVIPAAEAAFKEAAPFFKVAKIVSYSTIAIGSMSNLKSYFKMTVEQSRKI